MLRVKHVAQIRLESARAATLESGLSSILTECFEHSLWVVRDVRAEIDQVALHWFYYQYCDGREFGLALNFPTEKLPQGLEQFAALPYAERVIALIQRINVVSKKTSACECGQKYCCIAVEKLTGDSASIQEHSYLLHWLGVPATCRARVHLRESNGIPIVGEQTIFCGSADRIPLSTAGRKIKLTLCLFCLALQTAVIAEGLELRVLYGVFRERAGREFVCGVEIKGKMLVCKIMEESMSDKANEKQGLAVELSLGAIELALEDLLDLRPGMVIEFEKPEVFEASLMVAGSEWADAVVELDAQRMSLRITKILHSTAKHVA